MSYQTSLLDLPNVISSRGSADGRLPCASPDGPTINRCGPVVVLANLSARQAKALGLLTSGTFGRSGSTSSASAILSLCLANRLHQRLLDLGSTLYKLTWKSWVTPSGVCRSRLRASVLRTSATGLIGWPTPRAAEAGPDYAIADRPDSGGLSLQTAAALSGWLTPSARDHKMSPHRDRAKGEQLDGQVHLAGWPTPTTQDDNCSRMQNPQEYAEKRLLRANKCSNLAQTAQAFAANCPARLTASGEMLTGSFAGMENGGQLSPRMSGWLMGYPMSWCEAADKVTKKTRRK